MPAPGLAKYEPAMSDQSTQQQTAMRNYYRLHAAIYDATRWSFLFGRKRILKQLPIRNHLPQSLLEIGCGTGHNLRFLARQYHFLQLTGLDVSKDMLAQAARSTARYADRVRLIEQAYGGQSGIPEQAPDTILFSYALTMFNPGWEKAILQACNDLPAGGRIAVVDFHDTPSGVFRWWMGKNHVRMEGHILPFLQSTFRTEMLEIRPAWLGLWQYFLYIGVKADR